MVRWSEAMAGALHAPGGFYRPAPGAPAVPAAHFRTSTHVGTGLARALLQLLGELDELLGRPERLDLVDVGAGGGELLTAVAGLAGDAPFRRRLRPHAVEQAARPAGLAAEIGWSASLPAPGSVTGLLVANEWLDTVPVDVVVPAPAGLRLLEVDRVGVERVGPAPDDADLAWVADWWPLAGAPAGARAEVGRHRDAAWARAAGCLARGLALAIDYALDDALGAGPPPQGTLAGYRSGRRCPPVPDGSCDITAHVRLAACELAARPAGAGSGMLLRQDDALRALGIRALLPEPALAGRDPGGYAAALAEASAERTLLDPAGLGGFGWLAQPVAAPLPASLAGPAAALATRGGGR